MTKHCSPQGYLQLIGGFHFLSEGPLDKCSLSPLVTRHFTISFEETPAGHGGIRRNVGEIISHTL